MCISCLNYIAIIYDYKMLNSVIHEMRNFRTRTN